MANKTNASTFITPSDDAILVWYRPSFHKDFRRAWLLASLLLLSGAGLLGLSLYSNIITSVWASYMMRIVGALLTPMGPLYAVIQFHKLLCDDTYLALRKDGVVYFHQELSQFIQWEQLILESVTPTTLELKSEDGTHITVQQPFMDITFEKLHTKIKETQRKALLGIPLQAQFP